MDIDRNLLGRAAALLSEARDVIERVRTKAVDYQTVDEDTIAALTNFIQIIEDVLRSVDQLAKED